MGQPSWRVEGRFEVGMMGQEFFFFFFFWWRQKGLVGRRLAHPRVTHFSATPFIATVSHVANLGELWHRGTASEQRDAVHIAALGLSLRRRRRSARLRQSFVRWRLVGRLPRAVGRRGGAREERLMCGCVVWDSRVRWLTASRRGRLVPVLGWRVGVGRAGSVRRLASWRARLHGRRQHVPRALARARRRAALRGCDVRKRRRRGQRNGRKRRRRGQPNIMRGAARRAVGAQLVAQHGLCGRLQRRLRERGCARRSRRVGSLRWRSAGSLRWRCGARAQVC